MIVKVNETRSHTIKNKIVRGFTFRAFLQATAVNTVLTSQFFPSSVNVKCILSRMGGKYVIFQDTLEPLALESAFNSGLWNYARLGSKIVEVVAAAGAKEVSVIPYHIDFGDVIDVDSDDDLTVEVTVNSAAFGANVDASAAYVEFDEIEGQGFEYATPYIRSKSVKANEGRLQENLGDNVFSIAFINTDKNSVLSADDVIQNLTLGSKGFSQVETIRELKAKRPKLFVDASMGDSRYQSFKLYDNANAPLKGLGLDATLQSANVTTSKNFIVWRTFYVDQRLFDLASAKENASKARINSQIFS